MMRGHHSPSRLPTAFSQRSTGSMTWESAEMIRRSDVAMGRLLSSAARRRGQPAHLRAGGRGGAGAPRVEEYRSAERGQEANHSVGGGGRLLEAVEVAAVLDHLHVGARDGLGEILRVLD